MTPDEWADHALAEAINRAARRTKKRFGERKAFICGVAEEINTLLGFDWLVKRMIELNRKDLIQLSRADLVAAMEPEWVAASEISYLNATFHFVNVL